MLDTDQITETMRTFLGDVVIGFVEDYGVNGWRQILSYKHAEADPVAWIIDVEEWDGEVKISRHDPFVHKVDIDVVRKGIVLTLRDDFAINNGLQQTISEAVGDMDAGDLDVELCDVIVQAGLFGEIIYN